MGHPVLCRLLADQARNSSESDEALDAPEVPNGLRNEVEHLAAPSSSNFFFSRLTQPRTVLL